MKKEVTNKCDIDSSRFFGSVDSVCSSMISSLTRQDNEAAFLLIAVRNKKKSNDDAELEESEYFGEMRKYKPELAGLWDHKTSGILAKATADFLLKQRPKFLSDVLDEIVRNMDFEDLNMLASIVIDEQEEFARGYK